MAMTVKGKEVLAKVEAGVLIRPGWCVLPDGSLVENHEVALGPDGLISGVGTRGELAVSGTTEIIEAPMQTLLPGLIDLHVLSMHIGPVGSKHSSIQQVLTAVEHYERLLRSGVTTIRDTASDENLTFDMRDLIERGELIGPTLYTAGRIIGAHSRGGAVYRALEVNGADEARRAAREQLRAGVDFLSIAVTNGLAGGGGKVNGAPGWQELRDDEVAAIVVEAHSAGRRASANCLGADGIRAAVLAGCDTIEHATELDRETADLMAERGTVMVPTLTIMHSFAEHGADFGLPPQLSDRARWMLDRGYEAVNIALDAGVTIAAGTDTHGNQTVVDEIRYLEKAGLSFASALSAATSTAAEMLEPKPTSRPGRGRIQAGTAGDLVLVEGKLASGFSALSNVSRVIHSGNDLQIGSQPSRRGE